MKMYKNNTNESFDFEALALKLTILSWQWFFKKWNISETSTTRPEVEKLNIFKWIFLWYLSSSVSAFYIHSIREDTHKKVFFLVVGSLRV